MGFYWVFYQLAQGILFYHNNSFVYKDTKCMTGVDTSTIMGHERVRG